MTKTYKELLQEKAALDLALEKAKQEAHTQAFAQIDQIRAEYEIDDRTFAEHYGHLLVGPIGVAKLSQKKRPKFRNPDPPQLGAHDLRRPRSDADRRNAGRQKKGGNKDRGTR